MSKITVTYLGSRRFESQPFVDALNEGGMPAELVELSGGKIERLKKTIRSTSPYIIVDTPYLSSITLALMKKAGVFKGEYLIRLRGDAFIEMQSFRTPFLKSLTDMSIDSALSVLPVAKYLEDRLKRRYQKTDIHTIYNGIDIDLFSPEKIKKKNSREVEIATVMNFSIPEKFAYFSKLPSVIQQLSGEYDIKFSIIGGGEYLNNIKKLFSKSPKITFLGELPRSEIADLLSSCDIFFYPTSLDILPNAVLEASAVGLPVVSTDIGGISEIVLDSETGLLFKDLQECKSKLKLLIEDGKLRSEMGKKGRERIIEKFSWAKTTERFVEYIKSLHGET